MHQCLSCNQPCSLFSAFCDTCRASLLARRDQASSEEQSAEMVVAGGGNDVEGGYPGWEPGESMASLRAFSQSEASPIDVQAGAEQALPPVPERENGAWSFETTDLHAMETLDNLADARGVDERNGTSRATHTLVVPRRQRRPMPRNVRRALLLFCIVGTIALLTDGILLALSIARHHMATGTRAIPSGIVGQPGLSPTRGSAVLTPTGAVQVNATSLLVLSTQRLVFSTAEGQDNLAPQTVTLSSDPQGFSWRVDAVNALPTWLRLSAWRGSVQPGIPASFSVSAYPTGLAPGAYSSSMQVKAFDARGQALSGSPVTLLVMLNVHPPCGLSITPAKLTFTSVLASAPTPQTLILNESSGCVFPVFWQVSSDESWVTFSRSSGTDSAAGSSIIVQASSSGKLIGSSTAHITFHATDATGTALAVTPTIVTATLTVVIA